MASSSLLTSRAEQELMSVMFTKTPQRFASPRACLHRASVSKQPTPWKSLPLSSLAVAEKHQSGMELVVTLT